MPGFRLPEWMVLLAAVAVACSDGRARDTYAGAGEGSGGNAATSGSGSRPGGAGASPGAASGGTGGGGIGGSTQPAHSTGGTPGTTAATGGTGSPAPDAGGDGGAMLHDAGSSTGDVLALPGAQGFGRFAVGARGYDVYHVTNLDDSGAGSLRDAISQANRTVVFDVGGVIHISSRLVFKNNQTIAGQTAPGGGVTIYGDGTSFSAASHTIVRYVRFRMGKVGESGKDTVTMANGHNVIWDHCSLSWGRDSKLD